MCRTRTVLRLSLHLFFLQSLSTSLVKTYPSGLRTGRKYQSSSVRMSESSSGSVCTRRSMRKRPVAGEIHSRAWIPEN